MLSVAIKRIFGVYWKKKGRVRKMKIADYQHDLFTYAKLLLGIDSPTGYTTRVVDAIGQVAESLEFGFEKTTKGCGLIHVPGRDNSKKVAVSAHIDLSLIHI